MRNALLILVLLGVSLTQTLAEENNDKAAIIAETKSYVAANSGMTRITATVEQVDGDFARVKVAPENASAADPAWVFLQKKDGKWIGIVLGNSLTTEDYQQLGIPNALRIP